MEYLFVVVITIFSNLQSLLNRIFLFSFSFDLLLLFFCVYVVGVICYILLSGRPPFNGKSDGAIFKAVLNGAFDFKHPLWRDISREAKDFIGMHRMKNVNEDKHTLLLKLFFPDSRILLLHSGSVT